MSGLEAPSMRRLWDEIHGLHPSWDFAGILGNPDHQARVSSHNWVPGHQESALVDPRTGRLTPYPAGYAHALDATYWGDLLGAGQVRNALLLGPRRIDVRYVIDHRTGVLYLPDWRGGGTGRSSSGHPHLHTSGAPWCTFGTDPWLGPKPMSDQARALLALAAGERARRRRLLEVRRPRMSGRDVRRVQEVLNQPLTGVYGGGTSRAVGRWQTFVGLEPTGTVNRRTWESLLFVYLAHRAGF